MGYFKTIARTVIQSSLRMHCHRCQKSVRSSEGVQCEDCASRFHVKCVTNPKDLEGGDRGYQWKCAVCQHPARRSPSSSQVLRDAINQLSEKIEVVNKIQLPKLNSDLLLLKATADRIVKLNEDILNKITQLTKTEKNKEADTSQLSSQGRSRRRRSLNLSRKPGEDSDAEPIIAEKCARHKNRRRSYHLYKVLLLVNRKLHRSKTPRNISPR